MNFIFIKAYILHKCESQKTNKIYYLYFTYTVIFYGLHVL